MQAPLPRGPLSALVLSWLHGQVAPDVSQARRLLQEVSADVICDEDRQLTLWMLYELHYTGFDQIDAEWEWSPECLAVRRLLEAEFEDHLRTSTLDTVGAFCARAGGVAERLFGLVAEDDSPSLGRYIQRQADRDEALEFLIHRSIYNLKEADAHTWAVPRLTGAAKVALVELQYDEYGTGNPDRLHSQLFANTMRACGLDSRVGAYIDEVPAVTLSLNNGLTMFGLHRRLTAAAMGHLAAFEASSSQPSRQVARGLRRLGFPEPAAVYFDEHVEADAVHEQVATRNICEVLVTQDPQSTRGVFFGAATGLYLDARVAGYVLDAWAQGRSALLPKLPEPDALGA